VLHAERALFNKATRTILEVGESRENNVMKAKEFKCAKKEEV